MAQEIAVWVTGGAGALLLPVAGYWVRGLLGKAAGDEVKRVLNGELAKFHEKLTTELNGKFLREKEFQARHAETDAHISHILETLRAMHEAIQDLQKRPWPVQRD